jgi:hypothetical protein
MLVLIALLLAACSSSAPAARTWGAGAEAWTTAFTAADPLVSAPFYDPHVLFEMHGFLGEGYGMQGLVAAATDPDRLTSSAYSTNLAVPPFLSRGGAVLQTQDEIGAAWVMSIGPSGVERQSWTGSTAAARTGLPGLVDDAVFQDLPDRYVQAWRSRDDDALASVYARHAVVVDTLAGVQLVGVDEIGRALRSAGGSAPQPWLLSGARLTALPGREDAAVYVDGWAQEGYAWDRLLLVLEAETSDGCTGQVAAVLDLDDGMVVRDERFHRLDAVRRCLRTAVEDAGWWSPPAAPLPRAASAELVEVPGRLRTTVIGGDGRTAAVLLWAAGRFADAGLPPPTAPSTLVVSADPRVCLSKGHRSSALVVELCGAGGEVCADTACTSLTVDARAGALHQLGHLWLDRRTQDPAGCPATSGPPGRPECLDPPVVEEVERDVAVLVWGLMDEDWTSPGLSGRTCDDLATAFRRLTGTAPMQRCDASGR